MSRKMTLLTLLTLFGCDVDNDEAIDVTEETTVDLSSGRVCFDVKGTAVCLTPWDDDTWVTTWNACRLERFADRPLLDGWGPDTCAEGVLPGVPVGFDRVECREPLPGRSACWAFAGDLAVTLEPPCVEEEPLGAPDCAPALGDTLLCAQQSCYHTLEGALLRVAATCQLDYPLAAEVACP